MTITNPLFRTLSLRASAVSAARLPCQWVRYASSKRWLDRQTNDHYSQLAKIQGLRSRAAFKLLEINETYKLFKPRMTVVDLGYAPGSWSEVAIDRVSPGGRVVGLDIIPAQPPKGVSSLQGDFLCPSVQSMLRDFLSDPERGRARTTVTDKAYIDIERQETEGDHLENTEKTVDVVLSDMWIPWELPGKNFLRSLTSPYARLMNTSGIRFKDHHGSMDLCDAALTFCLDVLKPGGHFVCKFLQGADDMKLEAKLKKLFHKVHRDKPDSSRKESRELYFVALKLKGQVSKATIEQKPPPTEQPASSPPKGGAEEL